MITYCVVVHSAYSESVSWAELFNLFRKIGKCVVVQIRVANVFQEPVLPSTAAARLPSLRPPPRSSFAAIVAKATAAAAAANAASSAPADPSSASGEDGPSAPAPPTDVPAPAYPAPANAETA